jgi:hypothetical protein
MGLSSCEEKDHDGRHDVGGGNGNFFHVPVERIRGVVYVCRLYHFCLTDLIEKFPSTFHANRLYECYLGWE